MAEPRRQAFGSSRLVPENPERLLGDPDFSVFQIDVKSESRFGRQAHHDTLEVLTRLDMGIGRDWRVELLRVNAELPANPVRRSAIWFVHPKSKTAVGVEYKYHKD
jgi:hypothetical protein